MDTEDFLKPRLRGARFEGGAIPLNVLADFAVLGEMVVEVAKAKYKQSTGRSRVPRGFMDGIFLKLAGVEKGSAVPVIRLTIATAALFPSPSLDSFRDAKAAIIGAIGAAERGQAITDHLPQNLLAYFDRFGRSLEDGEAIEFAESATEPPVRLTQQTRYKLQLASSAKVLTDDVVLYGLIPAVDQKGNTFQILLLDGTKVKAPLTSQHYDTVMEACFVETLAGGGEEHQVVGQHSEPALPLA